MRIAFKLTGAMVAGAMLVAACGESKPTPLAAPGPGSELTDERYCQIEGLAPSLRHTYIMIDEKVIAKAETAAEASELNATFRDLLLNFGDPQRAIASGATDYRERISAFILPADGSAAYRIFTGCVPGLTAEETAAAREGTSSLDEFVMGDSEKKQKKEFDAFRSKLLGALRNAVAAAKAPASSQSGLINDISVFQSLRASGRLINTDQGLPRVIILTDLGRVELPELPGVEDARNEMRKAGFDLGAKGNMDFSRADIAVVDKSAANDQNRDFMDAFLLAQHGKLVYWGNERVGALPTAPARVARYVGTAAYPNGEDAVQIRFAADRNGKLVNSWVIMRGRPDRSIPMSGTAVCDDRGECTVRSDEGGFAQAWSMAPGGEPEFDPDLPFSGLRDFEFTAGEQKLAGKVYDPSVDVIGPPGSTTDSIKLDARIQADATF